MIWLTKTLEILATLITFGANQYVSIDPCPCGKPGARLDKTKKGEWFVYCPYGCRRRSALANTRRRAKQNWNKEITQ